MWFKDEAGGGKAGYYGFDGQSKRRAFLASPMEFSRVTSGFAMRMHPIQNVWKAHLGVDYGAPTGTPVRAVGGTWIATSADIAAENWDKIRSNAAEAAGLFRQARG